jgi:hypothetical protein
MNNPVAKNANKFNRVSTHQDKKNDYQRSKLSQEEVKELIEEDNYFIDGWQDEMYDYTLGESYYTYGTYHELDKEKQ